MTAKFTSNPPPKTQLADVVGFRCVAFHIFLLNSLGNKDKSIKYFKSPPPTLLADMMEFRCVTFNI